MKKKIENLDDFRSAAVDSDDYTDGQIIDVLVEGLRAKAYRRGLMSGALLGCLITFITWILL